MSSDRVSIGDDCITAFSELRSQRHSNKPRYIIYRITEDYNNVVVEESSFEKDYEVFRRKLVSAIDSEGRPAPRYAVYDVEYDLGSEGKRYVSTPYHSLRRLFKLIICQNKDCFHYLGARGNLSQSMSSNSLEHDTICPILRFG